MSSKVFSTVVVWLWTINCDHRCKPFSDVDVVKSFAFKCNVLVAVNVFECLITSYRLVGISMDEVVLKINVVDGGWFGSDKVFCITKEKTMSRKISDESYFELTSITGKKLQWIIFVGDEPC